MNDLQTKVKRLPKDILSLLQNDDLVASIFVLADEMKISDLQALGVEDATVRMLAGDLPPSKFADTLISSGLTQEKAVSVARTIATDIISPVETSLKEMYHVSGPLVSVVKITSVPQAPKPPVPPTQQSKPPTPTPTKTVTPPQAAPTSAAGPAKTFQKDLARAKSGLPPIPIMTPPVGIPRPEIPRPSIKAPARPPENLPGSLRPQVISSGKSTPSDSEPTPESIHVPKNAFEEKLQRTVGGAQKEQGLGQNAQVDPYREPLE